ncbi:MAG: 3-hydroxyacyl-CoA dehydrogenase NAD-binding domain-containing protein, partial [Actinomycetota bacterium]
MTRQIESVAVLGAGTMGAGIAAICAAAGRPVHLLDVTTEAAEAGRGRVDEANRDLVTAGTFDADLDS